MSRPLSEILGGAVAAKKKQTWLEAIANDPRVRGLAGFGSALGKGGAAAMSPILKTSTLAQQMGRVGGGLAAAAAFPEKKKAILERTAKDIRGQQNVQGQFAAPEGLREGAGVGLQLASYPITAGVGQAGLVAGAGKTLTGAVSGGTGGLLTGIGLGLEEAGKENLGAAETVSKAAGKGIAGAAIGAAAGAAIGKLADTGKLTKEKAAEIITSPMSKAEKIAAARAGRLGEPGLITPRQYSPGARTLNTAQLLIDKKVLTSGNLKQGLLNIDKEIGRVSEREVIPLLKAHNRGFNAAQINKTLEAVKTDKPIIFTTDGGEKFYDKVITTAKDQIKLQPKNALGLWEARKAFDRLVAISKPRAFDQPDASAINQAIINVRRAMNDYIVGLVESDAFSNSMSYMTRLFESGEAIAENMVADKASLAGKAVQAMPVVRNVAHFLKRWF